MFGILVLSGICCKIHPILGVLSFCLLTFQRGGNFIKSQGVSVVKCPQCNSLCNKITTPLTNEYVIECKVCGYQEIKTISSIETFKGYGSIIINNTAILFHNPIPFEKEQQILKSISETNATFIKWTDKNKLTVLKGELEYSEEEIANFIAEEEYYKSLVSYNTNDFKEF